jgi:hypothetical protein
VSGSGTAAHARAAGRPRANSESGAIGTTGRGIGSAYEDEISRTGIRVGDLLDEAGFTDALARNLREKNGYLEALLGEPPHAIDEILAEYRGYRERLVPFVTDTGAEVRAAAARGARVLLEGAQGSLLDVDHGTYPFVTSSTCLPRRRRGRRRPAAAHDRPRHRHRQGIHHARRRRPVHAPLAVHVQSHVRFHRAALLFEFGRMATPWSAVDLTAAEGGAPSSIREEGVLSAFAE